MKSGRGGGYSVKVIGTQASHFDFSEVVCKEGVEGGWSRRTATSS